VELPKFITFLKNKVDREIESIKDAFEQGRIPKENYDISVGELKGLRTAKDLLLESAKNISDDNDKI
jgi:hypothetical protein|tara:strand:+ start:656 stop:856 length:201 start_codon:yes stop_codon:yes gene_type:complete